MKLWMKKLTVFLITIMTLGLYVPPLSVDAEVDKGEIKPSETDKKPVAESEIDVAELVSENAEETEESNPLYLQGLSHLAKEQLLTKLGTKIESKINTELNEVILPNLETVLDHLYEEVGLVDSQYLIITEEPAAGYGERIFNLYNVNTKQDIAKFHVNRLNKPQDGYYFQFHYHLQTDQYESHFPFGEIYWGKNTPPKWMS